MNDKLGIYELKKCYFGIITIPYNETDLCEIVNKNFIVEQIEKYENKFDNLNQESIPLVSIFYKYENEYFNFKDGKMYCIGEEIEQIKFLKNILEYCDVSELKFSYNEEIGMDQIVADETKIKKFLDDYLKEKKVKIKK